MLGFGQDPQLPQLLIEVLHKGRHPGLDGAEIVVVQLLALGRPGAKEGAPGIEEVRLALVNRGVHQEILLFRPDTGMDALHTVVAKAPENPQGLAVQGLHGAAAGGLFVQGFPP